MSADENPDEHHEHDNAGDPPNKGRPGAATAFAKFLFYKIVVVEIFAGQIECVTMRRVIPSAAFVRTTLGAAFAAGPNGFAANRTIARWLKGHGGIQNPFNAQCPTSNAQRRRTINCQS